MTVHVVVEVFVAFLKATLIPGDKVDVSLGAEFSKAVFCAIRISSAAIDALEEEFLARGFSDQVAVSEFLKAVPEKTIAPTFPTDEAIHNAALESCDILLGFNT